MTTYIDRGNQIPINIFEGFLQANYEMGSPIQFDKHNKKVLYSTMKIGKKCFEHAMDDFEKFRIKKNINELIELYKNLGYIDENDNFAQIPPLSIRGVSDCSWFLADVYDWMLKHNENPRKRITKNGTKVEFDNLESPDR